MKEIMDAAEEDAVLVKEEESHKLAKTSEEHPTAELRRKKRRIPKGEEKQQWTVRMA